MTSPKKPDPKDEDAKRERGTEVATEETERLRGPQEKDEKKKPADELSEGELEDVSGGAKVFTPGRTQRGPLEGS